jgi:hypothetical protein
MKDDRTATSIHCLCRLDFLSIFFDPPYHQEKLPHGMWCSRYYGDFCDPADLTAEHMRDVYKNTIRKDDPLRKFCIMIKCIRTPINQTLADPDFRSLMEEGGTLVSNMETCMKTSRGPSGSQV